jgi:hypothetical protein
MTTASSADLDALNRALEYPGSVALAGAAPADVPEVIQ